MYFVKNITGLISSGNVLGVVIRQSTGIAVPNCYEIYVVSKKTIRYTYHYDGDDDENDEKDN